MKHRRLWTAGFAVTVVVVALALYIMFTYQVALTLPKFTIETILIMIVFSFPASYTSRWIADYMMKQSTHIGDVFKESVIGVGVHWIIYFPELMIYNYVVFGEWMEFPSLQAIQNMIPSVGILYSLNFMFIFPLIVLPLLRKMKNKGKWYEETNLSKNMEVKQ